MAIPSSGALRLSYEIGREVGNAKFDECKLRHASRGQYEAINTNSASYPDGNDPHSMTEWYSYDHSASSGVDVGSYGNGASNILFTGNQGTSQQEYSVDISHSSYCNASVVGHTGHIYFRFVSTTNYRQDAQLYQVDLDNAGWVKPGQSSGGTYGYGSWKTTRLTTNAVYSHSSLWYTVAAGTTAGRWNRDTANTPSGATGVNIDYHIYYEGSGSNAYNKDVYLRSPAITFTTDTIKSRFYAYGAGMGTLYMGVYITGVS